jgi:galactokinase
VMSTLDTTLREFKRLYGREPEVASSAPGRLDFLNTHQDYKGLPVVSVAINKRTYVAVSPSSSSRARVVSLNLRIEGVDCTDEFDVERTTLRGRGWFGDYIRSVVITLRERLGVSKGFDMLIYSEVPIGSGLASSAALQVATIKALSDLWGLDLSKSEIAELAYISEHDVMGIPCGRLDQYGSSFGYISKIETKPPYRVRTLKTEIGSFVAINSGIKHSTGAIHPVRIREIKEGLKKLIEMPELPSDLRALISEDPYNTEWEELLKRGIDQFLERLESTPRRRILFTLKMHYSTILALDLIESKSRESVEAVENFLTSECPRCLEEASKTSNNVLRALGGLINYQHVLLRDLYDVSTPELEEIRQRALEAGAIAVKISGAGLGGALLAITENDRVAGEVVEAVKTISSGAWIVEIDEGVRSEK